MHSLCHTDRAVLSPCCPLTRDSADLSQAPGMHSGSELGHVAGSREGLSPLPVSLPCHPPPPRFPLPEQLNSFFWISATLRPRSWAGAAHWVKSPMVGRWRSHCESQARWQSQKRWLECRRLRG